MSKKKKLQKANQELFNTKDFLVKSLKRYGIILLFAVPIMLVVNYILNKNVSWYTGAVSFFCNLVMLLTIFLIGLVIFGKKDEKEKAESTPEKERDPFAD